MAWHASSASVGGLWSARMARIYAPNKGSNVRDQSELHRLFDLTSDVHAKFRMEAFGRSQWTRPNPFSCHCLFGLVSLTGCRLLVCRGIRTRLVHTAPSSSKQTKPPSVDAPPSAREAAVVEHALSAPCPPWARSSFAPSLHRHECSLDRRRTL